MADENTSNEEKSLEELSYSELREKASELGLVVKSSVKKDDLYQLVADEEARLADGGEPLNSEEDQEDEASEDGSVTLESADDRVLRYQLHGVLYEGKSISVPAELAQGAKEALLARGYSLK